MLSTRPKSRLEMLLGPLKVPWPLAAAGVLSPAARFDASRKVQVIVRMARPTAICWVVRLQSSRTRCTGVTVVFVACVRVVAAVVVVPALNTAMRGPRKRSDYKRSSIPQRSRLVIWDSKWTASNDCSHAAAISHLIWVLISSNRYTLPQWTHCKRSEWVR